VRFRARFRKNNKHDKFYLVHFLKSNFFDSKLKMYKHLYFLFFVQDLYEIDYFSAHKFISEDLVKYAECEWNWDSELGNMYTCDMSPKYYFTIPTNLKDGITFL